MLRALGADIVSHTANPLWSFSALDETTLPDLSRVVVLCDVTNPLTGPTASTVGTGTDSDGRDAPIASTVPSPPSATGTTRTAAFGATDSTPRRTA